MEAVIIIMLLFLISIELVLILQKLSMKEEVKKENPRREITGAFKDPLGDRYRKNTNGLYRPVIPYREEDEDDDL